MSEPDEPDFHTSVQILLSQARNGETAARNLLFDRCRRYVGVVARVQMESWLQAKVDASDLVQQTLLEAHRGFDNFRGETEAEWLGWLRQILNNNAADFVRHWKKAGKRNVNREVPLGVPASRLSGSVMPDIADQDGATPSQIVMQHERELELAVAISRLSEDHQEIIILRNLQRLPFDDISSRMGRSRGACQMLWTRAIQQLQQLLSSSRQADC